MLVHDSTTDLVHVAARYDVGATEDPPGKHGMAHLAEHLSFLLRFGGQRLDEKLSSVSLVYNAYTDLDVTHYYSVGSDSELEALLRIEASRLMPGLCQTISDDDFAREREVVLNEMRTRYHKGATEITDLINDAVYGKGHPYDRRIIGTEEQVASITKQEACAFIDRYYVPAHVTVIITGNAIREAFGAAVEKTLATVPGRAPVPAHRPNRVTIHHATHEYKLPVDAAQLYLVWTLPPMLTPERAAAEMALDQVDSEASYFAGQHGFATSVSTFHMGGAFAPLAVMSVRLTSPGKAGDALDWIRKAVDRADDDLDEDVFVAAKQQALTDLVRGFDSLGGRANRFADYLQMVDGKRGYFIQEMERYDHISRGDVRKHLHDFNVGKAAVLKIIPDATAGSDYHQVAVTYGGMSHETGQLDAPVADDAGDKPLDVPLSMSRIADARLFTLDNGLRVALLPSSAVPIVDIRLVFGSGSAVEPGDRGGVAFIAGNMLGLDWSETSRSEVKSAVSFFRVGGSVRAYVNDDTTTFRVVGLDGYVNVLLRGLERTVKAGVYNQRRIEKLRSAIAKQLSEAGVVESQARNKALYAAVFGPNHPYATHGFWTARSFRHIGSDDANDYKSSNFVAANGMLIISGKFDPDLVEQHVRYNFAPWGSGHAATVADAPAIDHGSAVVVPSTDRPTVSISIAYPTPDGVQRDYAVWKVLAEILSRRVSSVRSELGASYGMSARLITNMGPGMLLISGDVNRRRAGEALRAVLAEIEQLRHGGYDADLALARRDVAARLAATTNSADSTADNLTFELEHDLSSHWLAVLVNKVAHVTPPEIQHILDNQLAPKHQSIIVYGPRSDAQNALDVARAPAPVKKPAPPKTQATDAAPAAAPAPAPVSPSAPR